MCPIRCPGLNQEIENFSREMGSTDVVSDSRPTTPTGNYVKESGDLNRGPEDRFLCTSI